jgi:hypothetical protein
MRCFFPLKAGSGFIAFILEAMKEKYPDDPVNPVQ